jgi:hypothetical protein
MKNKKVLALLILVCLVVPFLVLGCSDDDSSSSSTLEPGAVVKIEGKSSSTVCSTSKENHKLLAKYAHAKDTDSMEEMLTNGQIFLVDKGTEAIVLQTTLVDGIEIKIQSGPHKGEECWTERNFLTRIE